MALRDARARTARLPAMRRTMSPALADLSDTSFRPRDPGRFPRRHQPGAAAAMRFEEETSRRLCDGLSVGR